MAQAIASPAREGEQRKFINPTPGFVGANIFAADGKPTAIPVEPGGEVWLTPAEERMTAEAPRSAADNPFIKEWQEPVEFDPATGEVLHSVTRQGTLVLADDPPRPIASDRFIPPRGSPEDLRATREAMEGLSRDRPGNELTAAEDPAPEPAPETVTGTDELPPQPPVQGQPKEGEVIGTPEAPDANNSAVAARESTAEQPVVHAEEDEPLGI
jgi:hypothetical protein